MSGSELHHATVARLLDEIRERARIHALDVADQDLLRSLEVEAASLRPYRGRTSREAEFDFELRLRTFSEKLRRDLARSP